MRATLQKVKWTIVRHLVGPLGVSASVSAIPWSERSWEYPWVLKSIRAPVDESGQATKVLEVGPAGSVMPLWLHNLGYEVSAIDLRPAPWPKAPFRYVQGDIRTTTELKERSFGTCICISVLEHIGTPAYHGRVSEAAPIDFLTSIRKVLLPKGELLLTVPTGKPGASHEGRLDSFRVYAPQQLDAMLSDAGFRVNTRSFVRKDGRQSWNTATQEEVEEITSATMVNALAGYRSVPDI